MDDRMGSNVNGPSLIRVPDWASDPLGRYYLYFGHHKGAYIRLAYSDCLEGPWRTHELGVLDLADSHCSGHLASPDVHVDHDAQRIRMYYHGPTEGRGQVTRVALSEDGLTFDAAPEILGVSYFRVFAWRGMTYALGMPGTFYRSADGLTDFESGPELFSPDMRHTAVALRGDTLHVFYSDVGDTPERILLSSIELKDDWSEWRESHATTVIEPETGYEGADLPLEPSVRGWSRDRVRQLRDPAVFAEDGRVYLLYSVAGESGIAVGEVTGL
ncbi:hypothetical protein HN371_16845 [Candidatus Poribacteria bacterium]|nr:hypothetical protein [Candidatus Poribacteria bacterium]MBT5533556.1 hypothetical protein [Candidatus Poribacteria bacterium]MBT5714444.1 hypothetical protein [Candidatus Poribacteria bacterium]MBT7100343.1 hypothetical protein [Candidatus Poribacteria bacterium]MBT7805575.1 hypothetical protein [Candidatus Poribacteria bacterium]